MKTLIRTASLGTLGALLLIAGTTAAQAQVRITEVAPWSSGTTVAADWFELTNTGSSAVGISGWKMDDNSFSFASAAALTGITSIGAGESVIFLETGDTSAATINGVVNGFISSWFGAAGKPTNLQIGTYTGSGVGLSTSADGVIIFNGSGTQQAKVSFGASDATSPLQTFDNSVGADNTTISALSIVGTNGAFVAAADATQIGSPGAIAAVVPEPSSYALLLGGLSTVGLIARRRSGQQG